MASQIGILIPAYKPGPSLIKIVKSLVAAHDGPIIVVDDGGGQDHALVFKQLGALPEVTVLTNAVNLGKGAALKHGINYSLIAFPNLQGIVTADADGQHTVDDIVAVAGELWAKPEHLVLGARSFGAGTPMRSMIGNSISRAMYRVLLGLTLQDTQTGLRGLPLSLCRAVLSIRSNRYEFETEMLSVSSTLGLPVAEVPILTIYEDNNASSHFDPFFDSLRIYFVVLRYGMSSIATAIVDFAAFAVLSPILPNLVAANLASRAVAVGFQFLLLRSFVFHIEAGWRKLALFVLYVGATGVASGLLQSAISEITDFMPLATKIVVEASIFVFNFLFLRSTIFRRRTR